MTDRQTSWDDIMLSAISETIESMAFMEVLPTDDICKPDTDSLCVSMLVHDPVQGEFELFMGRELIDMLADTVYGPIMDEIPEQSVFDLLAEILNTVAGRFMSDILPGDTSFRLGVPELCKGNCQENDGQFKEWLYSIEESPLVIRVQGDSLLNMTPA